MWLRLVPQRLVAVLPCEDAHYAFEYLSTEEPSVEEFRRDPLGLRRLKRTIVDQGTSPGVASIGRSVSEQGFNELDTLIHTHNPCERYCCCIEHASTVQPTI